VILGNARYRDGTGSLLAHGRQEMVLNKGDRLGQEGPEPRLGLGQDRLGVLPIAPRREDPCGWPSGIITATKATMSSWVSSAF
jgi:hypothetical protein